MRIGIDAHHVNGKPQGSRTYLIQLIRALAQISDDDFLIYSFQPKETEEALMRPRLSYRRLFPESPRLRLPFVVPVLEILHGLDLFHSQYTSPPLSFVPEVVTIHDVLFETHPELFQGAFSRRSVALIRRSARRAQVVLTVSEFSRQALISCYHLPEDKVVVTPNAVDHEAFHPFEEKPRWLSERYGLDRPYLLTVGRLEPRKNLPRLLRAFARVLGRFGSEITLVLAGEKDFRFDDVVAESAKLPEGSVRFLDAVPDEDLPALYNLSEALVYPSLAEGFGMPVLEALACGTPVLASPRGALPEVGGDAVLWVDPEDEDLLAGGIERILTDSSLRKALSEAGPRRASGFSWEETARGTLAAYHRAAGPL